MDEVTEALLTIGIPTFNRQKFIVRVIQSVSGCAPILVVDDGSTDDTVASLARVDGLRLISHAQNLGYAQAFIRLFEECTTEYLLVSADDDFIHPTAVQDLSTYLQRARPTFVSTTWVDGGSGTQRGNSSRRIHHDEFLKASKHAPGLVYHVLSVKKILPVLKDAVESREEAALAYPQVVILAALLAGGADCWWSDIAPVAEGFAQESGIRTTSGATYDSFESQMQFRSSFARILKEMEGAEELRRANMTKLVVQVRRAVPFDLREAFEDAYRRRLRAKSVKRVRRSCARIVRAVISRRGRP